MQPFTQKNILQTPLLFIVFNRPESTRKVFEAIRLAKPLRLYVAADGPRAQVQSDAEKCKQVRQIITEVDWDCEVKTLFRDENMNCGVAPSTAFTWFFEHEEEGIILEDDCLPTQSFFWFCQELLERYREDMRVMHIGGNNFLNDQKKENDYSYYFSQSGHIWGWATWRRAWKMFDYKIQLYNKLKSKNYFNAFFINALEKTYRLRKFDKTIEISNSKSVDWWDYQWDFARYAQSGLSIVPNKNLVTNIGFGAGATHTQNTESKSATMKALDIDFPLVHPPFMIRDIASDKRYFKNLIQDALLSKLKVSIAN